MKVTALFLVFASICAADTIWNWDMTELPSGWTADEYWDFSTTGTHSYVEASTSGPYSVSQTALMCSDTLTVPEYLDTIVVCITDDWNWSGWWTLGESNCYIWFRLKFVSGLYQTIEFDSHSWGFDRSPFLSRTAEVQVPVQGGEEFWLDFKSSASASYGAGAEMAWNIENLFITDNSSTSLGSCTWAEIKRCMSNGDSTF